MKRTARREGRGYAAAVVLPEADRTQSGPLGASPTRRRSTDAVRSPQRPEAAFHVLRDGGVAPTEADQGQGATDRAGLPRVGAAAPPQRRTEAEHAGATRTRGG